MAMVGIDSLVVSCLHQQYKYYPSAQPRTCLCNFSNTANPASLRFAFSYLCFPPPDPPPLDQISTNRTKKASTCTVRIYKKKQRKDGRWWASIPLRAGSSNPKFRQPRMTHALATRISHTTAVPGIWYHADRHEQRGWHTSINRTGASTENVSRPITDLQRGQ